MCVCVCVGGSVCLSNVGLKDMLIGIMLSVLVGSISCEFCCPQLCLVVKQWGRVIGMPVVLLAHSVMCSRVWNCCCFLLCWRYVEGSSLFVCGDYIFNHYVDLKDTNYYVSSDKINDVLCMPVCEVSPLLPVLACQDNSLRMLKVLMSHTCAYMFTHTHVHPCVDSLGELRFRLSIWVWQYVVGVW